ncbi:hypothetical protein PP187_gp022 [Klebsiella phage vB_KvM-Eowyn]|uniref:Uncharacterized protein n=1 Tax=Klebsiella phage vB_KvM-Eowyn TaxID=2762819 RepID=A0A7R8R5S2_9CAUD|nr:hypothetical protein PP187_gp022 [Klebsiella phage vB_KvM-Eowyn]CAD5236011.1 hypothetical protein LLCLJKAH_00022 [Klebsiella phage vB_KvM-Eowyn]
MFDFDKRKNAVSVTDAMVAAYASLTTSLQKELLRSQEICREMLERSSTQPNGWHNFLDEIIFSHPVGVWTYDFQYGGEGNTSRIVGIRSLATDLVFPEFYPFYQIDLSSKPKTEDIVTPFYPELITRYRTMAESRGPSDETLHLLDMLNTLEHSTEQSLTKKHRWLGWIQGELIHLGATTVEAERDFTRDIFKGA